MSIQPLGSKADSVLCQARLSTINRRNFIVGSASLLASGCGGSGVNGDVAPLTIVQPSPTSSPTPPSPIAVGVDALGVQQFYKPTDGNNLQPAFQAALDASAAKNIRKIVNDIAAARAEMWVPTRRTLDDYNADGIPLIVRNPVAIDFQNVVLSLKGPTGGDRMLGQTSSYSQMWLGGWMNVIGHNNFDLISLENVVVDGGWSGDINKGSNLTDKAFRIQDTNVERVSMRNVELRNFAGEIYYIGGLGPELQEIESCHFHGSPQCAWNPGGVGKVVATDLRAGRSYQVAEVICGRGHVYNEGLFYDAGQGGATFFGGPSPGFQNGYPYFYEYWDQANPKPVTTFNGTRFERTGAIRMPAWARGKLSATDSSIWLTAGVGHLHDFDLNIVSIADRASNFEAVGLFGPPNLQNQAEGAPPGTFSEALSNIKLRITCRRTANAIAASAYHAAAARYFTGVVDGRTIDITVSGEARAAWDELGSRVPGFVMPNILLDDFRTV